MLAKCCAGALLAVLLPPGLLAQNISAAVLQPGMRVRLEAQCEAESLAPGHQPSSNRREEPGSCVRFEGTFANLSGDSLTIVLEGRQVVVARSAIRHLSAQVGSRGSAGIGAAIGGGIGLAVGLGIAVSINCDGWFEDVCETGQAASPLAGAAIGAGVGALIGTFIRRDRWVNVSLR